MLKHWTKCRLLVIPILIIIWAIVFVFLVQPYLLEKTQKNMQMSFYTCSIDFDVPRPAQTQIETLKNNDAISNVFPYYYTKASIKTTKNTIDNQNVLLSDYLSEMDMTMYNNDRCIAKSNLTFINPAYIDYKFATKNNLKLNQEFEIKISTTYIKFNVYAIYEANIYYENGAVLIDFSGTQKSIIESNPHYSYSGAYISASNIEECESYLDENYIPLGRLQTIDDFPNEEAYQTHYNAIMNGDYSNEITSFSDKKSEAINKYSGFLLNSIIKLFVAGLIIIITIVFTNILLRKSNIENQYLEQNNININKFYKTNLAIEIIINVLALITSMLNTAIFIPYYFTISILLIPSLVCILSFVASSLIMYYINIKKTNKIAK